MPRYLSIQELRPEDAHSTLKQLVRKLSEGREHANLPELRVSEDYLLTVMHEAASELNSLRGEISIRIRQNHEAKQVLQ